MAGIGIYGIFYAKATLTDGSVTGYTGGTKLLGEAIDASFEPNQSEGNPLYANNRVQENDRGRGLHPHEPGKRGPLP